MQVWGKTGSKLYGSKSGADYVDNPRRFRIFCEACIEAVRALPFGVGEDCIFVANDWHTAMLPVLLKVCTADGQSSMVGSCAATGMLDAARTPASTPHQYTRTAADCTQTRQMR